MLIKNLFKVFLVLTVMNSVTACGQDKGPTITPKREITVSKEIHTDLEDKKISQAKWLEFQKGFNERTVNKEKEMVRDAMVYTQTVGKVEPVRKVKVSERISQSKWEEFQKSFRERVAYYVGNIL